MRILFVSDIHSNFEALDAVVRQVPALSVDRVYCLGDMVGYNADPNPCVDWFRRTGVRCVAGNHDRASVGLDSPARFPARAQRAIRWTGGVLSEPNRHFLEALPIFEVCEGAFVAVHAALHPRPNCVTHLGSPARVSASMAWLSGSGRQERVCFFGHTHRPVVYEVCEGTLVERRAPEVRLREKSFYMVNPGSVGQSRDADPRASFAIFDTDERVVSFHRVAYDTEACARKTAAHGLLVPERRVVSVVAGIAGGLAYGRRVARSAVGRAAAVVRQSRPSAVHG